MHLLTAIILGAIQGVTEWLPVSSSGHLVIFQHILGVKENPVLFDAVVHLGTLFAVLLATREFVWRIFKASLLALKGNPVKNIKENPDARTGYGAVLATIPIVIVGLLLQDYIESSFSSLWIVAITLPITGIVLFSVRGKMGEKKGPTLLSALLIGIAQIFALIPGISRSGTTIVAGIHTGLERDSAARFSFLMAILAIAGAGALEIYKAMHGTVDVDMLSLTAGFLSSLIVGYISVKALLKIIVTEKFHYFAYYCWAVGGALIIYLLV